MEGFPCGKILCLLHTHTSVGWIFWHPVTYSRPAPVSNLFLKCSSSSPKTTFVRFAFIIFNYKYVGVGYVNVSAGVRPGCAWSWRYRQCGCWELNCPLQEPQALFSAKPSLQLPPNYFARHPRAHLSTFSGNSQTQRVPLPDVQMPCPREAGGGGWRVCPTQYLGARSGDQGAIREAMRRTITASMRCKVWLDAVFYCCFKF